MTAQEVLKQRVTLLRAGYEPLPLYGKKPPQKDWSKLENTSDEQLQMWARTWPDAINTGILTRAVPTLDVDILNEDAARAIEDMVRELYEEAGYVLTRIGRPPKRCFLFRTNANESFKKIIINFVARNGGETEKLEFLAAGQQVVVAGIHPDTQAPYRWFGGEPGPIAREDLPYIHAAEAHDLIERAADLLVKDFGYVRAADRPRQKKSTTGGDMAKRGAADWQYLTDRIRAGESLHDSLRDLAAKLMASNMEPGAAVNFLRAQIDASGAPHDERWKARRAEIPRLVESAAEKYREPPAEAIEPAPAVEPAEIEQTLAVFDRWLALKDKTPILAALGTVAANLLPGDPVWLGIIGPPSSAKTEILNATARLPKVVQAATLTVAGLLSGTPKKMYTKGAQGGLLRQIGDFGIMVLKDFGSILSMHTETRAELLAALREIYDGAWTRHLGSDGGRTLAWKGKVGLLFAATGVIDSHYTVIGSMGDRFLLSRLAPVDRGQFRRAMMHVGAGTGQMRQELAEAVARLFAGRRAEPKPISQNEIERIDNAIMLTVRLRGAVARDRQSREIEAVYGAEGTARIGLTLERLLAGLDTLGVERETAMQVVETVALDSVPPSRRRAYDFLHSLGYASAETKAVAEKMALPTVTVRRVLEELVAYGLATRESQGQGKADLWRWIDWTEHLVDDPLDSEESQ
jgi:hypothetical protein